MYSQFHVVACQYYNLLVQVVRSMLQYRYSIGHVRWYFDRLILKVYPPNSDWLFEHACAIHVTFHICLAMQLNYLLIRHVDRFHVDKPLPLRSTVNYFPPALFSADLSLPCIDSHLFVAPSKWLNEKKKRIELNKYTNDVSFIYQIL